MKYDDILTRIGEFGPYQKRVYYLLCLPAMLCGAQVLSYVFIYNIPSYRCRIPGFTGDDYTIQNEEHRQAVKLHIPPGASVGAKSYSECTIYSDFNPTSFLPNDTDRSSLTLNASSTEHCNSWVYDRREVEESVITEFDLVCELTILRAHSFMVNFAGSVVGSIVMGVVADVFGRKSAILIGLAVHFVTSLCTYFAPLFEVIIGISAINGIALHVLFSTSATTGIELVGPNKRAFTGIVVDFFWSAGVLALTPVAYLVRNWRNLQLILCLSSVPIFVTTLWCVPESPRWLLDKGKYVRAEKIMTKICKSNKTNLPPNALGADTTDEGPQLKIWRIFRYKLLLFQYFVVFFNWFVVSLSYWGLSVNTGNLAGSLFLNYLSSGLAEAVAYVACLPVLNYFGRRTVFCTALFICSFACFASIFTIIFQAPDWMTITLNMIGKFCGSMCYAVLYILSSEIFPTVLRYSGIGMCSSCANVGGMLSSYVADLSRLVSGPAGPAFHMIVFGTVSLSAALLALLLPETRDRILPETIQDAINFGRGRSEPYFANCDEQELEVPEEKIKWSKNNDSV